MAGHDSRELRIPLTGLELVCDRCRRSLTTCGSDLCIFPRTFDRPAKREGALVSSHGPIPLAVEFICNGCSNNTKKAIAESVTTKIFRSECCDVKAEEVHNIPFFRAAASGPMTRRITLAALSSMIGDSPNAYCVMMWHKPSRHTHIPVPEDRVTIPEESLSAHLALLTWTAGGSRPDALDQLKALLPTLNLRHTRVWAFSPATKGCIHVVVRFTEKVHGIDNQTFEHLDPTQPPKATSVHTISAAMKDLLKGSLISVITPVSCVTKDAVMMNCTYEPKFAGMYSYKAADGSIHYAPHLVERKTKSEPVAIMVHCESEAEFDALASRRSNSGVMLHHINPANCFCWAWD